MNNENLDKLLKSARTPGRKADYWQQFPAQVMAAARRPARDYNDEPRRNWGGLALIGVAAACLAIGLFVQLRRSPGATSADRELANARKYYSEMEALFPRQVQAIIFDNQGPHLVLADKADVPATTPLFLKVCAREKCEAVVTFSGQEIPFQGGQCEVLAKADGGFMLVGQHEVWSAGQGAGAVSLKAAPLLSVSSL